MCEVGSCCGCISLYRGCLLIGLVTILASAAQVTIFSIILSESYDSSFKHVNASVSSEDDDASFYSFKTRLCPFGFTPLSRTIRNESVSQVTLSDTNSSFSEDFSFGSNVTLETTKISCLAPSQGVLLALAILSGLYAPVGIILIIGVHQGLTCFLSTWFFYSVGYNLLGLIVAITDGVYTGATDISSYLVCIVMGYCIIVVDSYYEKLLKSEKVDSAAKSGPSLVVVESSPHDSEEGSPKSSPIYHRDSKPITAPPGYAPPGGCSEHLLPQSQYQGRKESAA